MKDSADIRKINKYKIKEILWQGGQYTKQQLALKTGLSVATCNTLLNEMEQDGEVTGEKKRVQDVGRESICYQINGGYESILCLYFELLQGVQTLYLHLLSAAGQPIKQVKKSFPAITYDVIEDAIADVLAECHNVSQIMVGTPSIAENGIIRHCDIAELENVPLVQKLAQRFHLPVHMENDMHFKAYGYYCKYGSPEEIISIVNYPAHVLPGTVSIHSGRIIQGKNQFAGMVGFLPYGIDRAEQLILLAKKSCRPLVSKAVTSIITIINPGIIVLTGDLLDANSFTWLQEDCLKYIPAEYMPKFVYEEDLYSYYLTGMYRKALDLKGVI